MYDVDIVIPARDEAELLPGALAAVRRSIDYAAKSLAGGADRADSESCAPTLVLHRASLRAIVTVVADRCTDDTAAVAGRMADRVIEVDATSVGHARSLARAGGAVTRAGCGALPAPSHGREHVWLLNTDADSVVPEHWVIEHLRHFAHGAAAVAGTVAVDDWAGRPAVLAERYAREYARRNDHVHGANLGISAAAYEITGGFRDLQVGEDQDLIDRCRARGLRVDFCRAAAVTTSPRRAARAPHGFSNYLDVLELA